MTKKENKHLEDLKNEEPDLYEDISEIEDYFEHTDYRRTSKAKVKKPKEVKGIMILIAVFLALSVVGTLGQVLNIPSIQFLNKSQQLSKDEQLQIYKEAIVTVKSEDRKGTGYNISDEGFIVTNEHIVKENKQAFISFPNGKAFEGKVVYSDPNRDIAFMTLVNEDELPFLEVEMTKNWEKGDHIYMIGNPLSFNFVLNEGVIYGERPIDAYTEGTELLIDAPVYKGNSGSPIINSEGKVIGTVFAKTRITEEDEKMNIGIAIPIYELEEKIQMYLHK